jgi:serine/threonine-protein kinase
MLNAPLDIHPNSSEQPKVLDRRYQIKEILAAKLWGRIYLAQDLRRPSQSPCIIQHLKAIPEIPDYAELVRWLFAREAAVLEQLGYHDQIPALLGCFEDEDGFYVVQELIVGIPFSTELKQIRNWGAERVIQFLKNVLDPLAYVHDHGSLHGNLQPDNLLRQTLRNGDLCLIGFGNMPQIQLAVMAAHGRPVPLADAVQRSYQALEQLQGLPCPASDVYAVGMMAIQVLTGIHPSQFKFDPAVGEMRWQDHYYPESPLQRELVNVLTGMVQWDLSRRYATAVEALKALQRLDEMVITGDSWPNQASLSSNQASLSSNPEIAVSGGHIGPQESLPEEVLRANSETELTVSASETQDLSPETVDKTRDSGISDDLRTHAPTQRPMSSTPSDTPNCNSDTSMQPTSPDSSPHPDQADEFSPNPSRMGIFARPAVRFGTGGVLVATAIAATGFAVFSSGSFNAKFNKLWQRVTNPQTMDTKSYKTIGDMTGQLRKDWQAGAEIRQKAEQAANQGRWTEVKTLASQMPAIPYWQDQAKGLEKQAIANAQNENTHLVQSAYTHARDKNFTAALKDLKQIPPGTATDALVKAKTQEYTEKQNIKAWADLQRAYDLAVERNFSQALIFLWQIPEGTQAYSVAQEKIVEYKRKQEFVAREQIKAAQDKAQAHNLMAALYELDKVPDGSALEAEAGMMAANYTIELNQQASQWIQKADQQAEAGDLNGALLSLEQVPIGIPAYAQAREKIAQYKQQNQQSSRIMASRLSRDLNPGHQLREAGIRGVVN